MVSPLSTPAAKHNKAICLRGVKYPDMFRGGTRRSLAWKFYVNFSIRSPFRRRIDCFLFLLFTHCITQTNIVVMPPRQSLKNTAKAPARGPAPSTPQGAGSMQQIGEVPVVSSSAFPKGFRDTASGYRYVSLVCLTLKQKLESRTRVRWLCAEGASPLVRLQHPQD